MDAIRLKKLEAAINRLPEFEKNRAILVVDKEILSWEKIIKGLKKEDDQAKKIEKKLMELLHD